MIEVRYVPKLNAIKVDMEFHCDQEYLVEVAALFDGLTRDLRSKELFMIAVSEKLDKLKKELEEEQKDDKNDTCNESDQ